MPIYEYRCEKCDREFEVEQRITDPALGSCPKCRSRKVRRLISQTSFVLKGSGWYSDLYSSKSSGSKPDSGAAEAGGDAKESKDSKPSETKEASAPKGTEGPGGGKKGKKSEPKAAA